MKSIILGIGLVGSLFAHAGAPALINPGTPDAAIVIFDPALGRAHPAQLQYLNCIGNPEAVWFEDFSADCRPGARARVDAQWKLAQTRALHPTGISFIPTEIEATMDR